jgi:hypothetical protein
MTARAAIRQSDIARVMRSAKSEGIGGNNAFKQSRRVRSSKTALENAMQAMAACGLSVHKLLISGAHVEIYVMPVEGRREQMNDKALKEW